MLRCAANNTFAKREEWYMTKIIISMLFKALHYIIDKRTMAVHLALHKLPSNEMAAECV